MGKKSKDISFFEQPGEENAVPKKTSDPDGFIEAHQDPWKKSKAPKTPKVLMTFRVTEDFRTKIKLLAIKRNKSITELIQESLMEELIDEGLF